ncbi:SGNH/GDSL hydrolase family protein [Mycobacterium sp. 2YAF39]|uniref:SGNH/GDSL hydrolase family protein n=1 Tax=Mycobacterium sp. 2YAF39 TaxID=3233033 RepID=UPI003F9E389F
MKTDTKAEVAHRDSPPSLLVIGDSFVAGAGVTDPGQSYPAVLAQATGMRLSVDGQGGTGFVNDAHGTGNGDTSKMIDRLDADGQRFPDASVVVIDAGRNDLRYPVDQVGSEVSEYLDRARAQWPTADIVVVVPAFIKEQPFDGYRDVLNRFENSASKVGATLIDPTAEGWYQNVDVATLVSADKVHPNADGARLIAERMEQSLRSHGLVPTTA